MRHDGRPVPRLHVASPLADGASAVLSAGQSHYLARVMRLRQGDRIRLFNGSDGEWLAELGHGDARCVERLRPQPGEAGPWLLFAPPRRERLRFLVEKATELGVARLQPVTTERTEPPVAKPDKMREWATEAAEQCGRLSVPDCSHQAGLDAVLSAWPAGRTLLFCDESGGGRSLLGACAGDVALLVGPEGGFSEDEHDRLKALPMVVSVSLGPHILRVETAAVAGLAAWQLSRAGASLPDDQHGAPTS